MIPKIWRKAIGSDDKLPFTDHLDELRHRLIISVVTVGVGFVLSYAFSQQILLLLQRPMPTQLVFIAPTEAFFVNLKAAFFAAVFLSTPRKRKQNLSTTSAQYAAEVGGTRTARMGA